MSFLVVCPNLSHANLHYFTLPFDIQLYRSPSTEKNALLTNLDSLKEKVGLRIIKMSDTSL